MQRDNIFDARKDGSNWELGLIAPKMRTSWLSVMLTAFVLTSVGTGSAIANAQEQGDGNLSGEMGDSDIDIHMNTHDYNSSAMDNMLDALREELRALSRNVN